MVAKTMQTKKKTTKKDLAAVREQLDIKRRQILSLYEHDLRVGQRSSDEGAEDLVDRANSAHHREFLLSLSGAERDQLIEIEEAMQRVDQGEFPVSLFQTPKPGFYEKLGARKVNNRFVNSKNEQDPEADPWPAEHVMIYPTPYPWPEGVIDLNGPGY